MEIKIKDTNVKIKFSFRAELLYEDVKEHSFAGQNLHDWILYFYCTVTANTADGFIEYDDFIVWLDENPEALYEFIQWYSDMQNQIINTRLQTEVNKIKEEDLTEVKKKVGRKKSTKK